MEPLAHLLGVHHLTTFYLPHPLKAHALSAAVGSGKTRAAVAYLASPANASRNFLYVAPTIELGTQTAGNLREAIGATSGPLVRNVHLINSRAVEGKVRVEALKAINGVTGEEGQVHILTTQTLLDILAGIDRPHLWSVILDEAFTPATFDTFGLGADVHEGWAYFCDVFEVDSSQGHRIIPKDGRKGLVADLADGRLTRAGGKYEGLQKVAKAVSNPASRCELVVTPRVAALLTGEALPDKRKPATESVLEYASYIAPEYFNGFREVLFLSALFEQTVLYHLWTKALGVTFEVHPEFPAEMLRDTHAEQGKFLAVGHLLHRDDTSSKENLGRNIVTGATGEKLEGQRVLDHIVRTAASYFDGTQFLLQVNNNMGYWQGKALVPTNAVIIPAHAHGLNTYQDVNNVTALCITNPNPQQLAWVKARTGMTAAQVTQSWRIHSVYQALGRCAIRKAEPTTDPKTVLVAGAADARFLHDLFPGSAWLGQVGHLPSLKAKAARAEGQEVGKVEALAQVIRQHLQTLEGIDRISSRALRYELMNLLTDTSLRVQMMTFAQVDSNAWTRAVSVACSPGSGWRKQGQSLFRVTADDYGFASSTPHSTDHHAAEERP